MKIYSVECVKMNMWQHIQSNWRSYMADNKITIGKENSKEKNTAEIELLKKGELYVPVPEAYDRNKIPRPKSPDDNLWGNDWQINKSIDKDYLAEKRLFVRVRYIQHMECKISHMDPEESPHEPDRLMRFTIFDISMGGIGAICEEPVAKDSILVFSLQLDHMFYEINCQVIYCIPIDNVFRLGLKILTKEKNFVKHLKLFVARLSLMGSKITIKEIIDKYSK